MSTIQYKWEELICEYSTKGKKSHHIIIYSTGLLRQSGTRKDLNADFENVLTNTLMLLSSSTNDTKDLYNGIRDQYLLGNDYINVSDPKSIQGFIDVSVDVTFLVPH